MNGPNVGVAPHAHCAIIPPQPEGGGTFGERPMGSSRETTKPAVIEPVPIADVFATGLVEVEERGGFCRLTFYADRNMVFDNGQTHAIAPIERIVVARIVLPVDSYKRMIRQFLGTEAGEELDRRAEPRVLSS